MRAPARLLAVPLALLAGCGGGGGGEDGGRVEVVATTTHAADVVRAVGGERVSVRSLLGPAADPHEYEPRPSDARAVAEAALVVRSGGEVDAWLDDVIDGGGGARREITLIDHVRTRRGDDGVDPHWWQDPRNAMRAARAVAAALAEADPAGAAGYRAGAREHVARLERLDRRIARCMAAIPERRRKLVTTHDSLGYFADRYGLEIVGSVLPSLSSQAQPSAGDTDRLVRRIRAERVEAVFPESALDPRLERAIAREAGVEVADPLWADALGPAGSGGETYLEAMAANADAIARGLTGGERGCPAGAG